LQLLRLRERLKISYQKVEKKFLDVGNWVVIAKAELEGRHDTGLSDFFFL
jgi:hypothetical protein